MSRINLELRGANEISLAEDQITPIVGFIILTFATGYFALLVFSLLSIRKIFLEAANQRWLSLKSVRGFRLFALANLGRVLYETISGAVALAFVNMPRVEGSFSVQFGITDELISVLFTAFVMLIAAHIFAVSQAAYEENKGFI